MHRSKEELWRRFEKYYTEFPSLDLALDISRMNFADDFFQIMAPRMERAFAAMAELEKGFCGRSAFRKTAGCARAI